MEQKRDLGEFGHKHLQCFHRLVPKSVDIQWAAGEVALLVWEVRGDWADWFQFDL